MARAGEEHLEKRGHLPLSFRAWKKEPVHLHLPRPLVERTSAVPDSKPEINQCPPGRLSPPEGPANSPRALREQPANEKHCG